MKATTRKTRDDSRLARGNKRETALILLQILVLFGVGVAASWSMWATPALVAGHSAKIDLDRLVEFNAAIRAGEFFPTWAPDLYSGYGSPIFQFYPALTYYFAEVPVLIGVNYAAALKIIWLLALFASGLSMYVLASTYFSGWVACSSAAFYMLAPYRLVNMFVRHALAEHCAFIWLPLIVWGTATFISKSSRIAFFTGVLATAGLIYTHNVLALIGLPICIAVGWALASPKGGMLSAKTFAVACAVAALGVGLAAFFWWPAINGLALTNAESSLTSGIFDFHRHFVEMWQFFDVHWSFGISGADSGDQMPLQIGVPHFLAGLGALVMVLSGWQGGGDAGKRRTLWSIVGVCVMTLGVFMSCRWSQPLWESLPLIKYVQFPWRFLGLVVFGAAMCATALIDRFAAAGARSAVAAPLVGIVIILAAYFPYYSQARFLVANNRTLSLTQVLAADVHDMQSSGVLHPFGLSYPTPATLRQIGGQGTSGDDFLPRDVKEKPTQPPSQIVQAENGRVVESTKLDQNQYRSTVQMFGAGKAELLQFWFPGWQAKVDGLPVETAAAGPQAIVSADVAPGEHVVEFSYRGLPQRTTGFILSILCAAIGACALLHSFSIVVGSRPR